MFSCLNYIKVLQVTIMVLQQQVYLGEVWRGEGGEVAPNLAAGSRSRLELHSAHLQLA